MRNWTSFLLADEEVVEDVGKSNDLSEPNSPLFTNKEEMHAHIVNETRYLETNGEFRGFFTDTFGEGQGGQTGYDSENCEDEMPNEFSDPAREFNMSDFEEEEAQDTEAQEGEEVQDKQTTAKRAKKGRHIAAADSSNSDNSYHYCGSLDVNIDNVISTGDSDNEATIHVRRERTMARDLGLNDFNEATDLHECPQFMLGQRFSTKLLVKKAIKQNTLMSRRQIKVIKDEKNRVGTVCKENDGTCPWVLHVSPLSGDENTLVVKTYNQKHECNTQYKLSALNSRWLGNKYLGKITGPINFL